MLYQKLITGDAPYVFSICKHNGGFEEHRHPEVEFLYAKENSFDMYVNRVRYTVPEGGIALISPMVSHSLLPSEGGRIELIEAGPALLRQSFNNFYSLKITSPVVVPDKSNPSQKRLLDLLEENIILNENRNECTEMQIVGNIYKICGYILEEFSSRNTDPVSDIKAVEKIDKALNLIHSQYAEPLTVELASEVTGYGKSNFCKIFRQITGQTFHNALSVRRIEVACMFLSQTSMSVSEVATEVGFADTKSFCRVFKSIMGKTASEYKKDLIGDIR